MTYILRMRVARTEGGDDMLQYVSASRKEYDNLTKARAGARRKVNFINGFYMCGIYEQTDKDDVLVGSVVFDSQYRYGRASGVFYVPRDEEHEGYRAHGVNADGTLNNTLYRLT